MSPRRFAGGADRALAACVNGPPMRILLWLVLALAACKSHDDRDAQRRKKATAERAAAENEARRKFVEWIRFEARPRIKAFQQILEMVDSLPPPASPPDPRSFDAAAIPIVQPEYLRSLLAPREQRVGGTYQFGDDTSKGWLRALVHASFERFDVDRARDYDELAKLTHVAIVKTIEFELPVVRDVDFRSGRMKGIAYVFDVATQKPIGGVSFEAYSSPKVKYEYQMKYEYRDIAAANRNLWASSRGAYARSAIVEDFVQSIDATIRRQLGSAPQRPAQ